MATESTVELKEYHGNCHCGAFKLSVKLPQPLKTFCCNCSSCSMRAAVWAFPEKDEDVTVVQGEGTLKEYEFGNKTRSHKFCPTCGTYIMAVQKEASEGRRIGINVRSFREFSGVEMPVPSAHFDGAALPPAYEAPPGPGPAIAPPASDTGLKEFSGNCHCGAVRYTVVAKPFEDAETKVTSCNCSLCSRNGEFWIYPKLSQVVFESEEGAMTGYQFGKKNITHQFCGTCGVPMSGFIHDLSRDIKAVNTRTLNGVDVGALKIKKFDGWTQFEPSYEV